MYLKKTLVFDYETLDNNPRTATAASLAAIVFNSSTLANAIIDKDLSPDQVYRGLVKTAFYTKFNTKMQVVDYDRTVSKLTLDWWSKQSPEARKQIIPRDDDVSLVEGHKSFLRYLAKTKFTKHDLAFCRGQSFDFPILTHSLNQALSDGKNDESKHPVYFWNQRDLRSYIAGAFMDAHNTKMPLPKSIQEHFVHHDPIHDCAKDAMTIIYIKMMANGWDGWNETEFEILG